METYQLDQDIKVLYVEADSFPGGIKPAFMKLHQLLGNTQGRKFFGISRGSADSSIIYRAAVEQANDGESKALGLPEFTIKAGKFISQTLHDYMKDVTVIGKAFQELLAHPGIDKNGYCLEEYISDKTVRCMVPVNS